MRATICRKAHFNAAHRLHNKAWPDDRNRAVFGKCNNPNYHGHNYLVEVKVNGEIDPETGYVIDAKVLRDLIYQIIIEKFDHKNLNLDTLEFADLNPTAENMARVIFDLLRSRIDSNYQLTIILHETESNYVEYSGT